MKITKFLPLAAIACAMVSCQNGNSGLSENASQTDSLMYYLGQINAADYLREAERDTTLKEYSSRKAYMDGVRAGLKVLKDGDETYNKGVMMGLQMSNNLINFSEQMEVNINESSYTTSLGAALNADTLPNAQFAQMEFRRILTTIENNKKQRDETTSRETLKQAAEAAGLPKIDDDLYGKAIASTDGPVLNFGDEVNAEVSLTKADGSSLNLPIQNKGKIGNMRSFPQVVSTAMLNLRSGEEGEFMTTAHALGSGRAQQLGLKPADIIKMKIKATVIPAEEKKEEPKK